MPNEEKTFKEELKVSGDQLVKTVKKTGS